jgi:methyltransferase (TIGR00027 family)
MRAYHHERSQTPVFDDPLAASMLANYELAFFKHMVSAVFAKNHPELVTEDQQLNLDRALMSPPAISGVLSRSRFTEDRLEEAIGRGVSQYVLIGAGLDTFAFRRTDLSDRLQVFEIDHAVTQALKRSRLGEAGLTPPANLHFTPANFEQETIASALAKTVFDPGRPSFFGWHGVTMYLSSKAIAATLDSVRSIAAPGSELVFDYFDQSCFDPANQSQDVRSYFASVASLGEPFLSGFEPASLARELASHGFVLVEDLGPKELDERFFTGRGDGLRALEFGHLAHARVDQS